MLYCTELAVLVIVLVEEKDFLEVDHTISSDISLFHCYVLTVTIILF